MRGISELLIVYMVRLAESPIQQSMTMLSEGGIVDPFFFKFSIVEIFMFIFHVDCSFSEQEKGVSEFEAREVEQHK